MTRRPPILHVLVLAALYAATALMAVRLTRFDGGVAFIWIATAMLIGYLTFRPRRHWPLALAACFVPGMVVTGVAGLGWGTAVPMGIANIGEAVLAASMLRGRRDRAPIESIGWLGGFVLAAGIVAPLASGALGAGAAWAIAGKPFGSNLFHWYAGHALGNLAFAPIAMLVARGEMRRWIAGAARRRAVEAAALLTLVAAVAALVFAQQAMPLLFLPLLPVILATFRIGRFAAACSIVLIAVIGGALTLVGRGPIGLVDAEDGHRLQFLQFYLACTVLTVLPVTADLARRRQLFRRLRDSEARYRALAEHSTDIILDLDAAGRIRFASPSIRQLGGYAPEALIGTNAVALVAPEFAEIVAQSHRTALAAGGEPVRVEYQAITATGERRWFETHTRAVVDEQGRADGVVSAIRDIEARKTLEVRLCAAAMTDPLTGLANRRAFTEAMDRHLASGGRGCVALFDIDHFKRVNDTYGHPAGDEVLRGFARIAAEAVREGDTLARIGGEEFGVLLAGASPTQARQVCERLRRSIAANVFRAGAVSIRVTMSGGVARIDDGDGNAATVMAAADAALYRAKRAGRDRLTLAA